MPKERMRPRTLSEQALYNVMEALEKCEMDGKRRMVILVDDKIITSTHAVSPESFMNIALKWLEEGYAVVIVPDPSVR